MGFDDLFENHDKHRNHGSYGSNGHHHDDNSYVRRSSDNNYGKHNLSQYLLNKIWSNKKLRVAFVILAIILLLVLILIIVALIPLLIKLVDYVTQNGIQGVVDKVTGFINTLWKGTGK